MEKIKILLLNGSLAEIQICIFEVVEVSSDTEEEMFARHQSIEQTTPKILDEQLISKFIIVVNIFHYYIYIYIFIYIYI